MEVYGVSFERARKFKRLMQRKGRKKREGREGRKERNEVLCRASPSLPRLAQLCLSPFDARFVFFSLPLSLSLSLSLSLASLRFDIFSSVNRKACQLRFSQSSRVALYEELFRGEKSINARGTARRIALVARTRARAA